MSSVKTIVDSSTVEQFLRQKYKSDILKFQFIKGGQLSQAFSFSVNNNAYVIKIRKDMHALKKEKAIFETLPDKDPSIPLPKIHDLGIFNKTGTPVLYYCICDLCEGQMLYEYGHTALLDFKSPFIEILVKINLVDISETQHYGHWEDFNKAPFRSWAEFMDDYVKSKITDLKEIFAGNSEELSFINMLEEKINKLLPFCSEERHLLHGDYGLNNTLGKGTNEITGIIDWELSKFGDFVYDIAWLEFWAYYGKQTYTEEYREIYEKKTEKKIANYKERLQCYTTCVLLHMVHFFCLSGQLETYQNMKKRNL